MGIAGWCLLLLAAVPGPAEEEEDRPPPEPELSANFGARAEGLVGTQLVGPFNPTAVTTNFVLEPEVLFQERASNGKLAVSYEPWLLYTPAVPNESLIFNRILIDAQQQISRTVGFAFNTHLWVGHQSFSPVINLGAAPSGGAGQGTPTTTTPTQVPGVSSLNLLDTSVRFGIYIQTSRQLRLDFAAGFSWAEGTNLAARTQLPLQRGPSVEARATYMVAPHDVVVTSLRSGLLIYGAVFRPAGTNDVNGSTVVLPHYNIGLDLIGSEAVTTWRHALSATLNLAVGAGVGVFYQSASFDIPTPQDQNLLWLHNTPVPAFTTTYPLAEASMIEQVPLLDQTLSLTETVGLRPAVNQFSGTVIERGDVTALAAWGVGSQWLLAASAEFAAAATPREIDVRGELRASFLVDPHLVLAAGARFGYLNYDTPGAFNGTSWVFFFSIAGATGKLTANAGASTNSGGQGFLQ